MHPHPSTELALKAFEADAAFSAALAQFQKDSPEDTMNKSGPPLSALTAVCAEARRAAGHGFSWFCRPSEPGFFEVRLRHAGGHEISAEGESITALLAGLLGHPLAHNVAIVAPQSAAEREQDEAGLEEAGLEEALAVATQGSAYKAALITSSSPAPQACPPASSAQAAAESLAAATGGAVVEEEEPDEAERLRLAAPLTDEQKAACVDMIKALTADQRKAFTIAFRHSFRVPREEKAIAPLITEVRHMEFCDRWSIENAGGVAP